MKNRRFIPFIVYVAAMLLIMSWVSGLFEGGTDKLAYSEVVELFQNGQVKSFEMQEDIIALKLHTPYNGKSAITVSIGDPGQVRTEMKELIRAGADSHSLVYSKDSSLKRTLRVWKNHLGNVKRFDQYNKVPEN